MSAATVTAVAGVAAAGAAAYGAYSQNKAAKDAAGGSAQDRYGSRPELVPFGEHLATEDSLSPKLAADVALASKFSLPFVFQTANKVQRRNERQRDRMTGGTFGDTIKQEGANILSLERGQVPQDVVESIQRLVAENLGGAFDPTAQGGGFAMSNTAADTARRLGLTSLDLMKTGMAFGNSWRSNVDSFLYKPQEAMRDFYLPQAQLSMNLAQQQYASENDIARQAAMPNPQVTGAANDALTLGSLNAQSTQNLTNALAGLVTGGANLYSSFNTSPSSTTSMGASARVGSPGVYSSGGTNLNLPMR